MLNADSAMKAMLTEVPKSVAGGIVDMASGMLLAVKTVESHPQAVIDLLASATRDLFEGDSVLTIENIWKRARGVQTEERYFQEVLVSSKNLWHYFGRLKQNPAIVMVVVCRQDVNMGLMLVKCRQICEQTVV